MASVYSWLVVVVVDIVVVVGDLKLALTTSPWLASSGTARGLSVTRLEHVGPRHYSPSPPLWNLDLRAAWWRKVQGHP